MTDTGLGETKNHWEELMKQKSKATRCADGTFDVGVPVLTTSEGFHQKNVTTCLPSSFVLF